jgi:hypothetical protein
MEKAHRRFSGAKEIISPDNSLAASGEEYGHKAA